MARIDDYKWGLEYEELEGLYMMALHELDAQDKRIAELEAHLEETKREWVYEVCEQCLKPDDSVRSVSFGNYTQMACVDCVSI